MLEWTKSEIGYVAGDYSLVKTPGKRWVVSFLGVPIPESKSYNKITDAKTVAQQHADANPTVEVVVPVISPVPLAEVPEVVEVSEVVVAPVELPVVVESAPVVLVVTDPVEPTPEPVAVPETAPVVVPTVTPEPVPAPVRIEPKPIRELPPWLEPGTTRVSIENVLRRLAIYADIGRNWIRYRYGGGKSLKIAS